MGETDRRRTVQREYNAEHGIVPQTVVRAVMNINPASGTIDYLNVPKLPKGERAAAGGEKGDDIQERLAAMRLEMFAAAENLEFEKAARLRDELRKLEGIAGVESGGNVEKAYEPYGAKPKARGGRGRASKGSARPAARGGGGKWRAR